MSAGRNRAQNVLSYIAPRIIETRLSKEPVPLHWMSLGSAASKVLCKILELNQKYQSGKKAQPFQKSGARAPQIEAAAHPASDKQNQKTRLLSNACAAAASPSGRTLTTRGRKPDTGSRASNSKKNTSLPSRPARQKIVIMAYLAFTCVPKICVCVFCLTVAFRSHSIPSGNVPANGSIHHCNNHEQQYG